MILDRRGKKKDPRDQRESLFFIFREMKKKKFLEGRSRSKLLHNFIFSNLRMAGLASNSKTHLKVLKLQF